MTRTFSLACIGLLAGAALATGGAAEAASDDCQNIAQRMEVGVQPMRTVIAELSKQIRCPDSINQGVGIGRYDQDAFGATVNGLDSKVAGAVKGGRITPARGMSLRRQLADVPIDVRQVGRQQFCQRSGEGKLSAYDRRRNENAVERREACGDRVQAYVGLTCVTGAMTFGLLDYRSPRLGSNFGKACLDAHPAR